MRLFRLRAGLMASVLALGAVGAGIGETVSPALTTASSPLSSPLPPSSSASSPSASSRSSSSASSPKASVPAPPVSPSLVEQALNPGASITVAKRVRTPAVPPKPDVVLLVDNTGSMGSVIANVKANLPTIVDQVFGVQPDSRFAVASFGDQNDPEVGAARLFLLHQPFTDDRAAIQRGVDQLDAHYGDDVPEDWGNGLYEVATGAGGRNTFRDGATPVVVLVGDAPTHEPSHDHHLADVIQTLKDHGVKVLAVGVGGDGLDEYDQATQVTEATGGTYLRGINANDVSNAIVQGLTNLPVTVGHRLVECDRSLSVSLSPPSVQLTSGQTASFSEQITVSPDAPQGSTLSCTVQFTLGPAADPAYREQIRITVNDVTAPTVTVDDRTVEATGPGGAVVDYPATARDNVDGDVPVSCEPPSGTRFPIGRTTVTCTATDKAGNTGRDTAVFTVVDTTAPAVNVDDRTVEATGPDGAVITYPATATDLVDGDVAVVCEPSSGSTFPIGSTTVTCTATDAAGNTGTDTAEFTVTDSTGPLVTVEDRTAEATGPGGAVVEYPASAQDTVDGNVPVTCKPPSGSTFPIGATTVTCTATDSRENTGTDTAVIRVVDTTPPVVTVDDRTVEATGPDGAVVEYGATAVDTVDGPTTVTCTPPPGSTFPTGATTVTCTSTDAHENTGTDSAVITVVDTTAPAVTVDDRTVPATGPAGAVIEYTATATDLVDGPVAVTCTPPSGSTFPVGKTTVTCTATDAAGNTGTDAAVFTVVDDGKPVVQVDDRTVRTLSRAGAPVTYTATAQDVVDGPLPTTCTPPSGANFPLGKTTVTCTATDKAGNTGSDTAVVTVILIPPVPVAPAADLAVTAAADPRPAFTGGTVTATFTLTNAGPDNATNVVLTSGTPGSATVVSPQDRCTAARPCTLPAGGRIQVTTRLSYDKATSGTLTARVAGTPTDPRPANNTDTVRLRVLQPVLTAGPAVARLGDVVLAEGRDFPAGTVVQLKWSQGITAATVPVRVGADGTFRTQVLVLRKDRTGPRLLRATGPGYDPLTAPVLVVPRSLQPPDFIGRG
ncbi:HYR domain-containing protein [Streptomyces sp. NY05-11A]|uniref:HYR domain-containing protein n=1 Tax=Streptomyces soliscabiei TaxID=588897 RepID=UPI0029A8BCDC|nr:HYR domain-containing protein [Streptomyces sp. NY05-11A]MDX2678039.1 HYR domain-containing protein [Streptomyces sp. NY05-11A]